MKYSLTELILNEYSDKIINQMVAIYKPQTTDSEEQIKKNIKDHNRLRDSIEAKLKQNNPAVLKTVPDDLQKNNRFKDITLIRDYNTLVRMLKAVSKKETDIYKAAIEYFKRKEQYMNPSIIGLYVGQFKKVKNELEKAVNEKDENVINLIPKELISNNKYNDILSYRNFADLEKLIDGAFPIKGEEKDQINSAEVDADKVYSNGNDGIEIYQGDAEHKCVKYGKNQYYSWCISRTRGSMYPSYRFQQSTGLNRMFYFVIDKTQPDTKGPNGRFTDPYHVVVIHALENGKYTRTTADNDGDLPYQGADWNELGKYFTGERGQETWNKIKGLQNIFTYKSPSSQERKAQGFKGQRINLESFIDLDNEDKQLFLRANAGDRNIINNQIIKSLDNNQINDLINYNMKFSFDELKKSQGLLKRYADYRFTRHPKDPIPYVFIPYLKSEFQKEYFEKFNDYVTFSVLEKYFNEDIIKEFVTKELNQLGASLPPEAKKYMTNEQRNLYDLYSLVFKDANYIEIPVDENSVDAPEQEINLPSISQKSFKELSAENRKKINDLYKRIENNVDNLEKYSNFFTGYPLSFELNGNNFLITPNDKNSLYDYVIMDEDGNVVKDNIQRLEFFKNNREINLNPYTGKQHGSSGAQMKSDDYDKIGIIYSDGKYEEISKNALANYLQEVLINKYMNRQLKYRAGILK